MYFFKLAGYARADDGDAARCCWAVLAIRGWRRRAAGAGAAKPRIVLPAIAAFALLAWSGRYWLFGNYSLSRDEEVAEFAAQGRCGTVFSPARSRPNGSTIAARSCRNSFSPFGADKYWNSAYLPLNSAFRALCDLIGDPNLAGPIFLVIGMIAAVAGRAAG
jgi:hypothetical protein